MKNIFYSVPLIFLIFSIVSMIRVLVFQYKLNNYLRENHTKKWEELTTVFGVGPGYANSLRGITFLLDNNDLGDPKLLQLKLVTRRSIMCMIVGFMSTVLLFFLTMMCYAVFYPKP